MGEGVSQGVGGRLHAGEGVSQGVGGRLRAGKGVSQGVGGRLRAGEGGGWILIKPVGFNYLTHASYIRCQSVT